MFLKNGIKIFFLVLLSQFGVYAGNTINVNNNMNLKKVLTSVQDGDTILLNAGSYIGDSLIVDKSITLKGINNPVIDGQGKYNIIIVTSNNVKITGITFKHAGVSFIDDNAAIKLEAVKNCVIDGNIFIDNFFSVYVAKSANCKIINNEITAFNKKETTSGNGIHLWYCKNILVNNNKIKGHRDGIYFEFVRDSRIKNNLSENNLRYGLHFMFSDSCSYSNNTFKNNGAGVAVMYTHFVEMYENKFIHNWGGASYGILLKEITDSKIYNNDFIKNSSGIYLEGCNRIYVEGNDFLENGWAIRLMANSMGNYFEKNNFIGNSFDIATNSVKNYNTFKNNYWEEYSGYDLNKDGVGDVPYRPVKLFSFIVERNRPALILLRSLFVGILDMAENVFPVLTPEALIDDQPAMKKFL